MADIAYREFSIYFYHKISAKLYLKYAQETEEGQISHYMSCLIFTALFIEAYVNHICYYVIEHFNEVDRDKKPKLNDKITMLQEKGATISLPENWKELNDIRNMIVHGKHEIITKNCKTTGWKNVKTEKEAMKLLESELEQFFSLKK